MSVENGSIIPNLESETKSEKILHVGGTMLLEITLRCYTGCSHCYKGSEVHPKAAHLDFETVKKRIDWIKNFTDAVSITLLGGEPLLHPDFQAIYEYIITQGFFVSIITSGRVSTLANERENLAYALSEWEKGDLAIELSLQPGYNERAYAEVIDYVRNHHRARRARLKQLKSELEANTLPSDADKSAIKRIDQLLAADDIFSTVTVNRRIASDKDKFLGIFKFVYEQCLGLSWASFKLDDKNADEVFLDLFEEMRRYFQPFATSQPFNKHITITSPFDFRFRIWGAHEINTNYILDDDGNLTKNTKIFRPRGVEGNDAICPAMTISGSKRENAVHTGTLMVRSDGELVIPEPSCIPMEIGLTNVDSDMSASEHRDAIRERIGQIQDIIIQTKAATASGDLGRCKLDPKFPASDEAKKIYCPSCRFDSACDRCHLQSALLARQRRAN